MKPIVSSWPVCGRCCEVAEFPWMGGAHHCGPEPDEPLGEWSLDTEDVEQSEAYEYGLDLLRQVVDNALSQVVAGQASTVEVTLLEDGGVQVSDDDGTDVRCWAASTIRGMVDYETLAMHLQRLAFLNKGSTITLVDQRPATASQLGIRTFCYPDGLVDYIKHINRVKTPVQQSIIHFVGRSYDMEIEVALQWNAGYSASIHTFANNIYTEDGGTHEQGFRGVLTEVVNSYVDDRIPLKIAVPTLSDDDIREGLAAVIAVRLAYPQYADESKRTLVNREVMAFTEKLCRRRLTRWFAANPGEADTIASKAISSYRARIEPRTISCRG